MREKVAGHLRHLCRSARAAAVYVFRPVRLDTSGAVSAQLHIVHNYGWELKYDGDLIPHIYSYKL